MTKKFDDEESIDKTIVSSDTFKVRMERADKAPPCLVMLEGPAGYVGKQWPIDKQDLVIGRSMTSAIFVDDRSVSKSHAKIGLVGGEVTIIDLESTNRTVINDDIIPPLVPMKMKNNDQIKVGNVLFKFLEQGSIEAVAIEQLQKKTEKDALTAIFNRAALLMKGPEAFKRAKLLKVPLSIAVFDVDHFKKVNDRYTHLAGDHVLRELASVVQTKLIRLDDFFARYGGEEFVVILFGSGLAQALDIGERLRATVEGHQFVFEGQKIPVTISVGVVTMLPHMNTWDELFAQGDVALYKSKGAGRNRVSTIE